ncbi:TetR/AcrR family transcriptional regulator [Spirillospora sp. NPDC048911]|uniref:TetR/AcrR family transcriptional regulator n=1 Tax=Spirillospora sp. NPDC048911 TaxID=3364527 RepID=UPI00371223CA
MSETRDERASQQAESGAKSAVPDLVWARPSGGRRPKLSREAIVEAAIKLGDSEGLEAVSIRRVAGELGVRAMSLYTHIERKEDLLALMVDEVIPEILVRGELPADWREAISLIARKERDYILRHPWIVELSSQANLPHLGPNALRHVEQSLAAVSGLTDDPQARVEIVAAVDHYMLGFVVREVTHRQRKQLAGLGEDDPDGLAHPYFRDLIASGEFPHLRDVFSRGIYGGQHFEQGLTWLLDGIERQYGVG